VLLSSRVCSTGLGSESNHLTSRMATNRCGRRPLSRPFGCPGGDSAWPGPSHRCDRRRSEAALASVCGSSALLEQGGVNLSHLSPLSSFNILRRVPGVSSCGNMFGSNVLRAGNETIAFKKKPEAPTVSSSRNTVGASGNMYHTKSRARSKRPARIRHRQTSAAGVRILRGEILPDHKPKGRGRPMPSP